MKTMTCQQLGGVCNKEFHAETFEEMAELSKRHGIDMYRQNDQPHVEAMKKMKQMMANPVAMNQWMTSKKQEFDQLPEERN